MSSSQEVIGRALPTCLPSMPSDWEVFNSLIGNAVKFGGPDVTITVRVDEDDGFVRVSVEDTGPGVPDDEKEDISHLYGMKKRAGGEWFGPYLVHIVFERYGGRIGADDCVPGHPEEGAEFRFTKKTGRRPPTLVGG